jgi:hypothetical protein
MLKMPNRWLQWLQNVQKPLAGLFRHLVWPKIEEDRLPGSFPFKLVVSGSPKRTSVCLTWPLGIFSCLNQHPAHTPQNTKIVEWLGNLAPNHGGVGCMGPCGHVSHASKGARSKHACKCDKWRAHFGKPFEQTYTHAPFREAWSHGAYRNRGLGLSPSPDLHPTFK